MKFKGIIRYVYKQMGKALHDYNMVANNDKILVAVSGGIDSLSLLKLFQMRQRKIPIHFDIIACFVDTNFINVNKDILIDFFQKENIPYVIKELHLDENSVDCFWCSWNRRKILFETAVESGCTKLSLGHNLDDIAETILMNMCFFGEISAMKPKLEFFKGKITVIRPLCYLEKNDILLFASHFDFPDTHYECPYGQNTRRMLVKGMLTLLKKDCSKVKKNVFKSLRKIQNDYLL